MTSEASRLGRIRVPVPWVALSTAVDNAQATGVNGVAVGPGSPDTGAGSSVTIDLGAVADNVRVLREHSADAATMVVVKADGYNHGAEHVARAALGAGASELGVTTVDEAVALRTAGIGAPILSWLHGVDTDFAPAIVNEIEIAVSSVQQLTAVIAAAQRVQHTAVVSLKIDTGLNRNGLLPGDLDEVFPLLARAAAEESVRFRAMFSHLACADTPEHPANDRQATILRESVVRARSAGMPPELVHLANSAATLTRPDLRFDMTRPGIAAYGLSPIPELGHFGLTPAMTVTSQIALVKRVGKGESVSYGHTWTAAEDTVVALVPMGYADGVTRNLSGRFDVSIGGRRFPSVGRVCMDQFVVDLGPSGGGVEVGDTAVLFGSGVDGEPLAQEWADTLGTIHYEVVTRVGGRARRIYRGGPMQPTAPSDTTSVDTTSGEAAT